jgi:hypothetical protein
MKPWLVLLVTRLVALNYEGDRQDGKERCDEAVREKAALPTLVVSRSPGFALGPMDDVDSFRPGRLQRSILWELATRRGRSAEASASPLGRVNAHT